MIVAVNNINKASIGNFIKQFPDRKSIKQISDFMLLQRIKDSKMVDYQVDYMLGVDTSLRVYLCGVIITVNNPHILEDEKNPLDIDIYIPYFVDGIMPVTKNDRNAWYVTGNNDLFDTNYEIIISEDLDEDRDEDDMMQCGVNIFERNIGGYGDQSLISIRVPEVNFDNKDIYSNVNLSIFGNDKKLIGSMKYFLNSALVKSVTFEDMDTSEITDFSNMLNNCENLITADIECIDISNALKLDNMFGRDRSLQEIKFNRDIKPMTNLDSMDNMFSWCSNLKNLDLSFIRGTTNLAGMAGTFNGCEKLENIDIHNLNTRFVTTWEGTFANTTALKFLDLSNIDGRFRPNNKEMFSGTNPELQVKFGPKSIAHKEAFKNFKDNLEKEKRKAENKKA